MIKNESIKIVSLMIGLMDEFVQVSEKMHRYMNRVSPEQWGEELARYASHLKVVAEEYNMMRKKVHENVHQSPEGVEL